MLAAPGEGTLKDLMEFGDTGCADHEQSPPHQRTHAAEHYAKLINRNGAGPKSPSTVFVAAHLRATDLVKVRSRKLANTTITPSIRMYHWG